MVPRLGTLKFITLLNRIEIIELMINVITIVIVINRTALFKERKNFTKESNAFFIFHCIHLPVPKMWVSNSSSNPNEDGAVHLNFLAGYISSSNITYLDIKVARTLTIVIQMFTFFRPNFTIFSILAATRGTTASR